MAIATSPATPTTSSATVPCRTPKNFKDVVSHADDAQSMFYLSLDNGWMRRDPQASPRDNGDQDVGELADNLAVVRALGGSAWSEGTPATA